MIATIKSISELLARDVVTVQEVSSALGEVIGGGERGVPFKIQPRDKGIATARVVRGDDSNSPSHVELTPVQPFAMDDLVRVFGAYRSVPRADHPNQPRRVSFLVKTA